MEREGALQHAALRPDLAPPRAAGPEVFHTFWEILHVGVHSGLPVGWIFWSAVVVAVFVYISKRSGA
jgi:hypothetical protein